MKISENGETFIEPKEWRGIINFAKRFGRVYVFNQWVLLVWIKNYRIRIFLQDANWAGVYRKTFGQEKRLADVYSFKELLKRLDGAK